MLETKTLQQRPYGHCKPRTMIRHCACLAAILIAATGSAMPARATSAMPAEFSVRWAPADGGPASAEAVLHALALPVRKPRHYRVEYFDVAVPAGLPPGFAAILRERTRSDTRELMYKLRGTHAVSGARCPLPAGHEAKTEMDMWFLAAGEPHRAWSFSCSMSLTGAIPPALAARGKDCVATMNRFEGRTSRGKVQVEAWVTRGGTTMFEVSRTGRDTPRDIAAFRAEVVEPLLALGARPLPGGMTQAACGN